MKFWNVKNPDSKALWFKTTRLVYGVVWSQKEDSVGDVEAGRLQDKQICWGWEWWFSVYIVTYKIEEKSPTELPEKALVEMWISVSMQGIMESVQVSVCLFLRNNTKKKKKKVLKALMSYNVWLSQKIFFSPC